MEVVFRPSQKSFFNTLRNRVNEYFSEHKITQEGNAALYSKTIIITALLFSNYTLLVFFTPPQVWLQITLCISLGILFALVGFNMMHDGSHGSYSNNKVLNTIMAYTLNILGGNALIWHQKHNLNHHTYTNIEHLDDDIDLKPFLRQHPGQKKKWFHRYQYVYAYLLYAATFFFWVYVRDFIKYFTGKIADDTPIRKWTLGEHFIFWFSKAVHITIFVLIPSAQVGLGNTLIGYVIMATFLGFILSSVFQLAHIFESSFFPVVPEANKPMDIETEWAIHQIRTTADFAAGSKVLTWMLGGLNYQMEHHLFPKISHVHYPAIHPIVLETCKEFGVDVLAHPTLMSALRSHTLYLKQIGTD